MQNLPGSDGSRGREVRPWGSARPGSWPAPRRRRRSPWRVVLVVGTVLGAIGLGVVLAMMVMSGGDNGATASAASLAPDPGLAWPSAPVSHSVAKPRRAPEVLPGDRLYMIGFGNPQLHAVDPRGGRAREVGRLEASLGDVEDIVADPTRPGVGLVAFWEGGPGLASIDLATGKATMGPRIQGAGIIDQTFVEGLAFIDGVLYASASGKGSFCSDCADRLLRIDPRTGEAEVVGKFGPDFQNVEAIAYSAEHGLIGSDIGTLADLKTFKTRPTLVKIDPRTGRARRIGSLPCEPGNLVSNHNNSWISPEGPFVSGLTFAPDGTLYGVTLETHFGGMSELWVIDPTTAEVVRREVIGALDLQAVMYARPDGPAAAEHPVAAAKTP